MALISITRPRAWCLLAACITPCVRGDGAGRWEWEADGDDLDPVRRHRNTTPCPPTLHPHRKLDIVHTHITRSKLPSIQPTNRAGMHRPAMDRHSTVHSTYLPTLPTFGTLPSVPEIRADGTASAVHLGCSSDGCITDERTVPRRCTSYPPDPTAWVEDGGWAWKKAGCGVAYMSAVGRGRDGRWTRVV